MNSRNFAEVPILWRPQEKDGEKLKKFQKIIEDKYRAEFRDYWEFHKWTINNIPEFWSELWDFSGIICSKKFEMVVDLSIPMSESPEWFQGAKLNLAENMLKYRDDRVAFIVAGEDKETERITYAQMYEEVKLYAAAFRKLGLKKGDTVACQMSNRKEAVIAFIAVVSIGAIWTGTLPFLGAEGVISRFKDISPKMFITVDRFPHGGKEINMLQKLKGIVEGLPSVEKVIIVASKKKDSNKISEIRNSCFLDEFLKLGYEEDGSVPQLQFEQVSSTHPVTINFTSGTTGMPKGLLHGWGILLSVCRDAELHKAVDRNTVVWVVTPVGWASWNSFAMLLFFGSTLALFEGVAYFLTPTFFWDLVDEFQISHLSLPSSILDEFQKRGYVPTSKHSLTSLKEISGIASVVKPQTYDFVFEKVKKEAPFSSLYGCTEIFTTCLTAEPSLPVYKGEMSAPSLGVATSVVDNAGNPVVGEVGDLVIEKTIPSLTLGILGDVNCSEFRMKYFSKYPGKFSLNDYGIINPISKGFIVCGRSDEGLKQELGVIFGSTEICNIAESFPEVQDSVCVSYYNKNMKESVVLFLKLMDGFIFHDRLVGDVRTAISKALTEQHVPYIILETKDIPYSINGKKMEMVVKKIINKMPYCTDTVRNPESVKYFIDVPELRNDG